MTKSFDALRTNGAAGVALADAGGAAAAEAGPALVRLAGPAGGLALEDEYVRCGEDEFGQPAKAGLGMGFDGPGAVAAALAGRAVLFAAGGAGGGPRLGGQLAEDLDELVE